jgi:hypothetical protein
MSKLTIEARSATLGATLGCIDGRFVGVMEGMVDRIDWGVLGMVDIWGGWSVLESTVVAVVLLFFVVSGQETKSTPTTLPTTTTIISRIE